MTKKSQKGSRPIAGKKEKLPQATGGNPIGRTTGAKSAKKSAASASTAKISEARKRTVIRSGQSIRSKNVMTAVSEATTTGKVPQPGAWLGAAVADEYRKAVDLMVAEGVDVRLLDNSILEELSFFEATKQKLMRSIQDAQDADAAYYIDSRGDRRAIPEIMHLEKVVRHLDGLRDSLGMSPKAREGLKGKVKSESSMPEDNPLAALFAKKHGVKS